jgi:TolB-like protein/Tfp pilus assembly protein PilF
VNLKRFFVELKRRHVYRVAVAYGIVSWLLIQVATQVFPFFDIPNWVVRLVVVLFLMGFPIAVVLAWAFELTPEGIKRSEDVPPEQSMRRITGRTLDFFIIGALLIVIAALGYQRLHTHSASPLAGPEKSIAILPFQNFSDEKENTFFADGVQDDILTDLAKVADLKVISRTSVMSYRDEKARSLPQIARELNVTFVVEGSVRRSGSKVRVSAQLIDARNGTQLWAEAYDRDLADVFAIQSEISRTIVAQLRAKLSPEEKAAIDEEPTRDLVAYDLYVEAKQILSSLSFNAQVSGKLTQAIQLLQEAIARDPEFVLAYCQLAFAHDHFLFYGLDHTPERRAMADAAVQTALRLKPGSGEAHLALAGYYYRCFLDYERARAELDKARLVLPNNPQVFGLTAYIDRRQGHWDDAATNLEKALQFDPRNSVILAQLSLSYEILRRFADMSGALDRALEIDPSDPNTRVTRALVDLEWRADPRPLHKTIDAILAEGSAETRGLADQWLYLALCERDAAAAARALVAIGPTGITTEGISFPRSWCEALVARMRRDAPAAQAAFVAARAEVEKTLRAQPDYAPALCVLGMIDAALGRKEDAIREGRRAVELLPVTKDSINGSHMITYLGVIYAWSGEKELALEQLKEAIRLPGYLSYGRLRLHPYWDSLRGDARFEALAKSLEPKGPAMESRK